MKKILVFILCLFSSLAWASDKHQTTDISQVDSTRTNPIPYPNSTYPVWLYVKQGQVFMQYHDPLNPEGAYVESQLTFSAGDKSQPLWGPWVEELVVTLPLGPDVEICRDGQLFFFLNYDTANATHDLYLNCINGLTSGVPTTMLADVQLTGGNFNQNYDIADYDVDSEHRFGKNSFQINSTYYEVVFTTAYNGKKGGELHHLLYRPENMVIDGSNYLVDHQSFASSWRWQNWAPHFSQYRQPKFFNDGLGIIFSARHSALEGWELGYINNKGLSEVAMTRISRDVVSPQVFKKSVVFGLEGDAQLPSLAYTSFSNINSQMTSWCAEVYELTTLETTRTQHHLNQSTNSDVMQLVYSRERLDNGLHDIYYAEKEPACDRTARVSPIGVINSDLFTSEIQLTCSNDNTHPLFFEAMNTDATHATKATDPNDIMMLEIKPTVSDNALVHLHNNPFNPPCLDDCESNATGDPLITDLDNDGLRNDDLADGTVCDNCENYNPDQADTDGDGTADACELIVSQDTCTLNADGSVLTINQDADADGLRDDDLADGTVCDNCDQFNPTQVDTNGDGIADACEIVTPVDPTPDPTPDSDSGGGTVNYSGGDGNPDESFMPAWGTDLVGSKGGCSLRR